MFTTLVGAVNAPGGGSLPCLSCHDGTQAIDAILNMPGSGGYNSDPNETFLDNWKPAISGMPGIASNNHLKLTSSPIDGQSCLTCHSPSGFANAVDFTKAAIGTDLRNIHPVGVTFPTTTGGGTDWKTPGGIKVSGAFTSKFFDENGNGRMDKEDIRMYDSGNGAAVECASCHDPHGVPAMGGIFNKAFLRKDNATLCIICHAQ